MHYHKIISIRKIDFPSQPSNENIDFICRHYYNFIDKSQTERNDIIMEDPDNILAIIDLDLNNASNTPRTIYNMLKKKHPHQHINLVSSPSHRTASAKPIQKVSSGRLVHFTLRLPTAKNLSCAPGIH